MSVIDRTNPFALHLPGPRVAQPHAPSDWVDEPYTRFTVTPVAPLIGAQIDGISLADPLDDATFAELNRALLEWKVLFFRDQDITPEQQLALRLALGPAREPPVHRAARRPARRGPEVVRLEKGPELGGYENAWHSDVTWREVPSLGSVLRAIEVPELGGDTLWADMGAAYDCLPDARCATRSTTWWPSTTGCRPSGPS